MGNPMTAVAKPKVPARAPKALQSEGTPERLRQAVAGGERRGRIPGPSVTSQLSPRLCSPGCVSQSCSAWTWALSTAGRGKRRLKVTGKGAKVRFVPIEARG